MSYLDKHLGYINAEGKSISDQQFNTTSNFINSTFADSPFYKVVKVNGTIDLEVRLANAGSTHATTAIQLLENVIKYLLLKPNTSVNIGDLVEFDNTYWLVTDFTSSNPLYPKAKIEKCNYTLQVKTGETSTLVGYDDMKRAEFKTQPTYTEVQCLLRTSVSNISLNQPLNIPAGQVYITVQFNDTTNNIKENDNFDIYNRQYKVIGMDYTTVINNVGCLVLIAERVVNKT